MINTGVGGHQSKRRIFLVLFSAYISLVCALPAFGKGKGCVGFCTDATSFLTAAEVDRIMAQAVNEAVARNRDATIAVTDRVGNVLGVFQMTNADGLVTINSGRRGDGPDGLVNTGLDQVNIIPPTLAAIAKAVTGAYLSTEGNAFSTRVASQIVQENFNPGERGQASGPLFGVQFSSLPCSDLTNRFSGVAGAPADAGPKRSPLGLSADPGGLPLYKAGAVVGAIGVIADGIYGLDLNIRNFDNSVDELIAMAGTFGFDAPKKRRAERITIEGKSLRFVDQKTKKLKTRKALKRAQKNKQPPATLDFALGSLVAVPGYNNAPIIRGTAFGQPASGIRADTTNYPGLDAFVLVDNANNERFPPIAGNLLTQNEVLQILRSALDVANRARAQIRQPRNSQARVTISVVDTDGTILGVARTRDAPLFGTDVSLQKARTAAFLSSAIAGNRLQNASDAFYVGQPQPFTFKIIGEYVTDARNFLNDQNALTGQTAFSDRAGGNLSRPFFPDGIPGAPNGPFSKPLGEWSPFSTGLQLDLVINGILNNVAFVLGVPGVTDVGTDCTIIDPAVYAILRDVVFMIPMANFGAAIPELRNGAQIFPGSVPIYKGNTRAGGIGISGDGIDQDDMISFLGLHNAGKILGTVNNAPKNIRADRLRPMGTRLRYVQCPFRPFIKSKSQDACNGK